jgi:hypothetical protein
VSNFNRAADTSTVTLLSLASDVSSVIATVATANTNAAAVPSVIMTGNPTTLASYTTQLNGAITNINTIKRSTQIGQWTAQFAQSSYLYPCATGLCSLNNVYTATNGNGGLLSKLTSTVTDLGAIDILFLFPCAITITNNII